MDNMEMPESSAYWLHLQKSPEEKVEVLHCRHYMRMWKRRRNHEPHDAVFKTGTSLLFGWPHHVQ